MQNDRRERCVKIRAMLLLSALGVYTTSAFAEFHTKFECKVRSELASKRLCAKLDFKEVELNSKDGVTELEDKGHDRVRRGDVLTVQAVDVSDKGLYVEIEVSSAHTRGETSEIEIALYSPIMCSDGMFINKEELWNALGFVTQACSGIAGE